MYQRLYNETHALYARDSAPRERKAASDPKGPLANAPFGPPGGQLVLELPRCMFSVNAHRSGGSPGSVAKTSGCFSSFLGQKLPTAVMKSGLPL